MLDRIWEVADRDPLLELLLWRLSLVPPVLSGWFTRHTSNSTLAQRVPFGFLCTKPRHSTPFALGPCILIGLTSPLRRSRFAQSSSC
jgi:hypothetical protein